MKRYPLYKLRMWLESISVIPFDEWHDLRRKGDLLFAQEAVYMGVIRP